MWQGLNKNKCSCTLKFVKFLRQLKNESSRQNYKGQWARRPFQCVTMTFYCLLFYQSSNQKMAQVLSSIIQQAVGYILNTWMHTNMSHRTVWHTLFRCPWSCYFRSANRGTVEVRAAPESKRIKLVSLISDKLRSSSLKAVRVALEHMLYVHLKLYIKVLWELLKPDDLG